MLIEGILLAIIVLMVLFFIIGAKSAGEIMKEIINVCCYVETYHYTLSLEDKIAIGQDKMYQKIYGDKSHKRSKKNLDKIFSLFYEKIASKMLNVIPSEVNKYNHRCLAEGEDRKIEKFLDTYQDEQEKIYKEFASTEETRCKKCEILQVKQCEKCDNEIEQIEVTFESNKNLD